MAGSRVAPMARVIGFAAVATALVGCYTLQPTGGATPQVGTRIAVDVNDVGRVALGGSMGPEIDQIEGTLVQRDQSDYVLAVSAVHLLRGGDQVWSGEQVHIKPEYVNRTYERQFSPGRTVVLSAIGAVLIGAFVSQSLLGSGNENPRGGGGDTAQAVRVPLGHLRLPLFSRP